MQCCKIDGTCVRTTDGTEAGCIGGYPTSQGGSGILPANFSFAAATCANLKDANGDAVKLCDVSCVNEGCYYNQQPVFSVRANPMSRNDVGDISPSGNTH